MSNCTNCNKDDRQKLLNESLKYFTDINESFFSEEELNHLHILEILPKDIEEIHGVRQRVQLRINNTPMGRNPQKYLTSLKKFLLTVYYQPWEDGKSYKQQYEEKEFRSDIEVFDELFCLCMPCIETLDHIIGYGQFNSYYEIETKSGGFFSQDKRYAILDIDLLKKDLKKLKPTIIDEWPYIKEIKIYKNLFEEIINLLKEKKKKLTITDISTFIKVKDIENDKFSRDEIKKILGMMYEAELIDFAGSGRYFIHNDK